MKNFKNLPLFIFAFIFALSSCVKTDLHPEKQDTQNIKKDKLLADLRQKVLKNPSLKSVIFPVNKKATAYFADLKGNKIDLTASGSGVAKRTYECAAKEDLENPPTPTLISFEEKYDCNLGYKFTITWNLSVSVNLSSTGPGSSVSRGRVRVKFNGYSTLYQDLNITPIAITDMGDDPNTIYQNALYKIVYETDWISDTDISPMFDPSTIETSFVVYTDCVALPSVVSSYKDLGFDVGSPCIRIDPIAIGNAEETGGVYSSYGAILGFGNILYLDGCPYPGNYADRQEVQIKYVGGSGDSWRAITPQSGTWPGNKLTDGYLDPFNATTQHGTIGLYDAYYIPYRDLYLGNHGNYLVRYRNVMYPLGSGCEGQWSAEIPAVF